MRDTKRTNQIETKLKNCERAKTQYDRKRARERRVTEGGLQRYRVCLAAVPAILRLCLSIYKRRLARVFGFGVGQYGSVWEWR